MTKNKSTELFGHNGNVKSIAYSPDGLRIASGSSDNSVIIWDAASGNKVQALTGHSNNVGALVYSSDGKYLVSGGNDNSIVVWDAKTGKYIDALAGHKESICTLSFVPGSTVLVSGDCMVGLGPFGIPIRHSADHCKITFWNIEAVQAIKSLDSDCGLSCAAFSPDGKYFVTGHAVGDRFITIYERK
jgi:WD40 repeat protein